MADPNRVVLDRDDLRRTLLRIAHEIVEKNPESTADPGGSGRIRPSAGSPVANAPSEQPPGLALVGIHTRGAVLARRLHALVGELTGAEVPLGDLDISFYRDDLPNRDPGAQPVVHASHLDFELDGRTVVLVDDVLFTGRTVRAAIGALFDYGRPQRVQLAVLADRGHRELPIRPDYVGKNLPTARDERVNVRLEEIDEVDEVTIDRARAEAGIAGEDGS
jgi:pyrimidine operon attenuation protein/uracil phosphoribosyltransferase